ncbi:FRG domain-containing protein [Maribellus sediminis]|uniref:FRG domain-containing protein n=1 Tax=Maribellus sediminis TaxID=2696285 RepID=UPI0014303996|nr:FRG domain-containing protein [Maribellus sediminis]
MNEKEDYFSKVPVWNSGSPKFEILSDPISGRIPVVKIEHWKDIIDILESDFFNQSNSQWIYRGHRRFDWNLIPTLGRLSTAGIVTNDLALKQINLFRQTIRGRVSDHSLLLDDTQIEELWSVGQHHGLHTPLLDWTYSPYVALFFAFHKEDPDEEEENPYRSIYILNKTFVDTNESFEEVRIFEPRKDDHGRLVSQAGLFIFTPTDATLENKITNILSDPEFPDNELVNAAEDVEANIVAKYICKIYIKNEDQTNCLKHLRRMNVHHASLFPDLIGAADYCNTLITEQELDRLVSLTPVEVEEKDTPQKEQDQTDHQEIKVGDITSIMEILTTSDISKEVEPGRIQLIAEELSKGLEKNKLVDWEQRESVQARLRNKTRVLLRKYGYPQKLREEVVNKVIEFELAQQEQNNDN